MNFARWIFKRKTEMTPCPPKGYEVCGYNNKIIVAKTEAKEIIPGLNIRIHGNNNTIYIEDANNFTNVNIDILNSDNSTIKFGTKYGTLKSLNNINIIMRNAENQRVEIGDRTLIWGAVIRMAESNAGVIIGKDCLFSDSINIWPADGHPVFDSTTNQQINKVKSPIIIGDRVWVGQGVRITKNTKIPDGCIIAGGAVACKEYKTPNSVIAGNPGKVVKENIY